MRCCTLLLTLAATLPFLLSCSPRSAQDGKTTAKIAETSQTAPATPAAKPTGKQVTESRNVQSEKSPAEANQDALTGDVEVSEEQLAKEFGADSSRTMAKYAKAFVTVSGTVDYLPTQENRDKVTLRASDPQRRYALVHFRFPPDKAADFGALVFGQRVKIRGKLSAKESIGSLQFSEGQLVHAGAPPEPTASFTAQELMDEHLKDPQGLHKKYSRKVIDVSGQVAQARVGQVTLRWQPPKAEKPTGSFYCNIRGRDEERVKDLTPGQTVRIRGKFDGGDKIHPQLDAGHLVEGGKDSVK